MNIDLKLYAPIASAMPLARYKWNPLTPNPYCAFPKNTALHAAPMTDEFMQACRRRLSMATIFRVCNAVSSMIEA